MASGIMGARRGDGNAGGGNHGIGPGVKGPEEKTMRDVSLGGRLAVAVPAQGSRVGREEGGGDPALVRPR
jgi:hypothetical protein